MKCRNYRCPVAMPGDAAVVTGIMKTGAKRRTGASGSVNSAISIRGWVSMKGGLAVTRTDAVARCRLNRPNRQRISIITESHCRFIALDGRACRLVCWSIVAPVPRLTSWFHPDVGPFSSGLPFGNIQPFPRRFRRVVRTKKPVPGTPRIHRATTPPRKNPTSEITIS